MSCGFPEGPWLTNLELVIKIWYANLIRSNRLRLRHGHSDAVKAHPFEARVTNELREMTANSRVPYGGYTEKEQNLGLFEILSSQQSWREPLGAKFAIQGRQEVSVKSFDLIIVAINFSKVDFKPFM